MNSNAKYNIVDGLRKQYLYVTKCALSHAKNSKMEFELQNQLTPRSIFDKSSLYVIKYKQL